MENIFKIGTNRAGGNQTILFFLCDSVYRVKKNLHIVFIVKNNLRIKNV